MGGLVGILLVVIAGSTVIGVLWFVMREQHVHEEYYIPQAVPPTSERTNSASTGERTEAPSIPQNERTEQNAQDTNA
jgi:hypothetical protein